MTPTTPTPDDLRARDAEALALLVRCETSLWRDDRAVLCFDLTEARAHIAARLDTLAAVVAENERWNKAATELRAANAAELLRQIDRAESAEQQLAAQAAEVARLREALHRIEERAITGRHEEDFESIERMAHAALAPQAGGSHE